MKRARSTPRAWPSTTRSASWRQRRRRELKKLLPELFRAYHVPPDVVGVVLRFVGYDLPGTARLPDRDPRLKQHRQLIWQ